MAGAIIEALMTTSFDGGAQKYTCPTQNDVYNYVFYELKVLCSLCIYVLEQLSGSHFSEGHEVHFATFLDFEKSPTDGPWLLIMM